MSNKPRAVLFEDYDSIRKIVHAELENAGYTVDAHTSPFDFITQPDLSARLSDVHVIWTDHSMPDMHGTEAAVTLRQNGFRGLIVMYSGDAPDSFISYQRPDFSAGNWRGPVFDAIHSKLIGLDGLKEAVLELKDFSPARFPNNRLLDGKMTESKCPARPQKPKNIYTTEQGL